VPRPLRLRLLLLGLGALVLAALAYGGWWLARLAPIGSAYAAKTVCSSVFVGQRDERDVLDQDLRAGNHPLLGLVRVGVDRGRRRVSATFVGFAPRVAQYRTGHGCTLAIGLPPEALEASAEGALRPSVPLEPAPGGLDRTRLETALEWAFSEPDPAALRRTRAVVVLHAGRLVAERYAPGFEAHRPMPGWSMTKTLTGALVGVLVGQRRLALDDAALLPAWSWPADPRAHITLDHLLRMTDGLAFNEIEGAPLSDTTLMLLTVSGAAQFAAAKPAGQPPGTHWRYANGTSNALMQVLRRAHGGTDAAFARWPREALFDPLDMRSALVETDALGMPVGSSFMWASPHDWARFGQFLLQDGIWNGRRLLPAGWVRYMTTLTPQSAEHGYGAHVWLRLPPAWRGAGDASARLPADAFHLTGHEGQLISVVPSRQLVVVRLGLTRARKAWDHEDFLVRVLDALAPADPPRRTELH
jgi:CubicO group peptidase (beta-lactamase class C family)